ncbi:putative pinoresinol-lariciresinol reductase 3 [Asimina triloba]
MLSSTPFQWVNPYSPKPSLPVFPPCLSYSVAAILSPRLVLDLCHGRREKQNLDSGSHRHLASGHPTFALVRPSSFSQPQKAQILQSLKEAGVEFIHGSLQDVEILTEAVRQVDVVICAVPSKNVLDQKLLIQAIKQAGCIKRFIPSEFGADPDKAQIHDIDHGFYARKSEVRRAIEKEGIPYTYVSSNFFMRILLPSLVQPGRTMPPRERITIFGDGSTKAVFLSESDVATFTLCTVDDPRTLNKVVYLRPPGNVCSINELIEMWELKIAKKLEKSYISGEQLLQSIKETPYPSNFETIFLYSAFVKGDHTYFDIESSGVSGTELYPHVKYTTVSDYLDTLV